MAYLCAVTMLVLIRHAQTPSNVAGALDTGVPGPGLTDLGLEQAEVLRQGFNHGATGVVYASSMRRAQQTAAPIASDLGARIEIRDGLREISAGYLEMRSDTAAVEEYHDFIHACADGRPTSIPGGESGDQVLGRFDAVVAEMAEAADGLAVAVSHGAMIRTWAGRRAANLTGDFVLAHPLRNTGIVVLEGDPAGGWTAVTWDATPLDATPVPTGPPGPAGEPDAGTDSP
jgi:broad specificity phosphatase PhoE